MPCLRQEECRSKQPGLASGDLCLCGWLAPGPKVVGSVKASRDRKKHWISCSRCDGPYPRKRIFSEKFCKAVSIGKQQAVTELTFLTKIVARRVSAKNAIG